MTTSLSMRDLIRAIVDAEGKGDTVRLRNLCNRALENLEENRWPVSDEESPLAAMRDRVLDFHRAFDCDIGGEPQQLRSDILKDRLRFTAEEFFELLESAGCHANAVDVAKAAVEACIDSLNPEVFDMVGFVDAHSDMAYFLAGTMVASGVNDEPMHVEVHRANMAKLWPNGKPRHRSGDGKVVKPPGWVPPDIEGELRKQGWKG